MKLLLFCITFLLSINAYATDHFIRDGASGGAPCTGGWGNANACDTLPATLVRGDTYYIADGNYPSKTFNTAASGTTLITIKKATASDHGTETGWVSTYGDGQAIWTAPIQFSTAYWEFNGQTRNESDWFDGTVYGFKIANAGGDMDPTVYMFGSNVTVSYTWMLSQTIGTAGTRTYTIDYEGGTDTTGTVVSHCLTENASNHFFLRQVNGATVEYCGAWHARSNANNHGESVNLYGYFGNSDNVIIRYNIFKDNFNAPVGQYGTATIAIVGADNDQVYGNVFANNWDTDGVIGWGGTGPAGYAVTNMKIYNNTFIDNDGFNAGIILENTSTGNVAYNNIFYGSYGFANISHSYNAFSGSNPSGETNGQANILSSIFVNYAGGDYRLASATTAGTTLASPYNTDVFGNTRGADSVWDRGAFEYVVGGGADSTPPTVSITAPSNGATVSGTTVTVSANASDAVGVVGVQFKLDGANLGAEDTSSPYGITWDSTTVINGSHALTAVARDAAGNSTTSSTITVTTNNASSAPPTVNSVGCSPTSLQSPTGTTICTPNITGVYTGVSWSQSSCSAQCTTASTTSPATYTCLYGGACTICANATNSFGTGNTACAAAIASKYKKVTNFRTL